MKPFTILFAIISSTLVLTASPSLEAGEKTSEQILRRATSPLELSVDLSKDIYRSEPYQAEYDVQIPYEADETYYVDIPYQETESYIDYETYYESEYKCHSHTEYETECHNEQQCHSVSDPEVCHQEQVCRQGQGQEICQDVEECGTNAHGERICKTRHVCRREPGQQECHYENRCQSGGSHQECTNENVCRQAPHERQECGYEQVEKTRPVTKYRTVTKYRQEARTRTVTKYRSETRCCVTQYRDVFDHQANLKTNVLFPAGSELIADEQELFLITMTDETNVDFFIQKSIFGYEVKKQSVQNGVAKLLLTMKPKYTPDDLGKNTIKKLDFTSAAQKGLISIIDLGLKPRIETKYTYQVQETESGKVIEQGQHFANGKQELQFPTKAPISDDLEYMLSLMVERKGSVISAPVNFLLQTPKVKNPLNPNEFSNPEAIQNISVRHSADDTELIFEDKSPLHPEVKTDYVIEIQRKGGFLNTAWKPLTSGQFQRTRKVDSQGLLHFSLKDDFHVNEKDLQARASVGSKLKLKITTTRVSPRLNNGQAIILEKEMTAKVE